MKKIVKENVERFSSPFLIMLKAHLISKFESMMYEWIDTNIIKLCF